MPYMLGTSIGALSRIVYTTKVVVVNPQNQPQLQNKSIYTFLLQILVVVVDNGVGILDQNLSFV